MYRILWNGSERVGGNAHESWGDLLVWLDETATAEKRLLTAIRLDGVDLPAFRGPEAAAQPLSQVALVEVEAVRPQDLVATSLEEADVAVGSLRREADRIGGAFRGYDVSAAQQDLVGFAETLGTLVTVTGVLSQAVGAALSEVACGAETGSGLIQAMTRNVEGLIDAQRSADWITVADIIEYDIGPALDQWPSILGALRAANKPAIA